MRAPNVHILQKDIHFEGLNICTCDENQELFNDEIHLSAPLPDICRITEMFVKAEIKNVKKVKLLNGKMVVIEIIKYYKLIYQPKEELATLHVVSGIHAHKIGLKLLDSYTSNFIPYINECAVSDLTNRSISLFTIISLVPILKDRCHKCCYSSTVEVSTFPKNIATEQLQDDIFSSDFKMENPIEDEIMKSETTEEKNPSETPSSKKSLDTKKSDEAVYNPHRHTVTKRFSFYNDVNSTYVTSVPSEKTST